MSVNAHAFSSKSADPFNTLKLEVTDDKVLIHVHTYEKSASIALSHEMAQRLVQTLKKELNRA